MAGFRISALICAGCNAEHQSDGVHFGLAAREIADGSICLTCPCGRDLALFEFSDPSTTVSNIVGKGVTVVTLTSSANTGESP